MWRSNGSCDTLRIWLDQCVTLLFISATLVLTLQLPTFFFFVYFFIAVEAVLKTEHRIEGCVLNIGRYQEKRTVVDEVS